MIGAERPGLRARHVHDAPAEARPTFESSSIVKAVRSLDAYPKVQEDYVIGSTAGGIITFVCAAICALLFLSEYAHHRTTVITSEVKVDTMGVDRVTPNAERLRVSIDVTFHALACELTSPLPARRIRLASYHDACRDEAPQETPAGQARAAAGEGFRDGASKQAQGFARGGDQAGEARGGTRRTADTTTPAMTVGVEEICSTGRRRRTRTTKAVPTESSWSSVGRCGGARAMSCARR